ncbi:MAG: alpha/beta hydrolase [Chloroflexi bacterium]|nr:alpha/beta hydrolase [Chloroflexota bacterium]
MQDPAIDKTVDLRGLAFHYREYEGPGRPIILLHGVASNSRIWITTAPLLAERFHVYALDQRGHGESAKPDDGYDFATVVADLVAFVDALEIERPVVVGHSWGGNVALEYAATHPESTAGLVMVDGGYIEVSARPGATWERTEQEMAPPDLTHLTPEQLIGGAKKWQLGGIWSDEVEAALMGNFEVTDAGTIRPHLSRANHMQVVRALWEQRPSRLFPDVRCPTLFAAAETKGEGRTKAWMQMKREAIELAEGLLQRCQVRWFEDTIHDIPLHRPRDLANTIRDFTLGL